MFVRSVSYHHFRNIETAEIAFSDGINILSGDNAVGKTSALEGIYLCALGRSHRTVREKDFIKFGEEASKIALTYEDRDRKQVLTMTFPMKGRKQVTKNGVTIRKMSEFIGHFRAVLFTPEHLSIIKDGPSERRLFLDNALSQLDPLYVASLQRYTAMLEQRNRILKEACENSAQLATIDIWSKGMAEEAAVLSKKRQSYCRLLDTYVKEIFRDMTDGREIPRFAYTGERSEEDFYRLFTENLPREIGYGATLFGVHKDDIIVCLNEKEARSFASQGQQRSLSLAMKLAEGEIAKKETGDYPVFLFDDVLSELDKGRRDYVMKGLSDRQVILTTCDCDSFPKDSYRINVKDGNFTLAV